MATCVSFSLCVPVCMCVCVCLCVGMKHMLGLCRKHKQTPTQERVKASKCEQNYVTKAFTRIIITIVPLRCNSSSGRSSSNRRNSFERARSTATLALSGSQVLSRSLCGPLSLGATVISSAAHPSRDPGKARRALYCFTWTCWLPAALVCVSVCVCVCLRHPGLATIQLQCLDCCWRVHNVRSGVRALCQCSNSREVDSLTVPCVVLFQWQMAARVSVSAIKYS